MFKQKMNAAKFGVYNFSYLKLKYSVHELNREIKLAIIH